MPVSFTEYRNGPQWKIVIVKKDAYNGTEKMMNHDDPFCRKLCLELDPWICFDGTVANN